MIHTNTKPLGSELKIGENAGQDSEQHKESIMGFENSFMQNADDGLIIEGKISRD